MSGISAEQLAGILNYDIVVIEDSSVDNLGDDVTSADKFLFGTKCGFIGTNKNGKLLVTQHGLYALNELLKVCRQEILKEGA